MECTCGMLFWVMDWGQGAGKGEGEIMLWIGIKSFISPTNPRVAIERVVVLLETGMVILGCYPYSDSCVQVPV